MVFIKNDGLSLQQTASSPVLQSVLHCDAPVYVFPPEGHPASCQTVFLAVKTRTMDPKPPTAKACMLGMDGGKDWRKEGLKDETRKTIYETFFNSNDKCNAISATVVT